jgi:hypothetical protein
MPKYNYNTFEEFVKEEFKNEDKTQLAKDCLLLVSLSTDDLLFILGWALDENDTTLGESQLNRKSPQEITEIAVEVLKKLMAIDIFFLI